MTRRQRTYLVVRGSAAAVFLLAATVLPRGIPAALLVVAAGLVAVASCLFTNAWGPGEQAGARAQDRWFNAVQPPQGDWPPYDPLETPARPQATSPPPAAS